MAPAAVGLLGAAGATEPATLCHLATFSALSGSSTGLLPVLAPRLARHNFLAFLDPARRLATRVVLAAELGAPTSVRRMLFPSPIPLRLEEKRRRSSSHLSGGYAASVVLDCTTLHRERERLSTLIVTSPLFPYGVRNALTILSAGLNSLFRRNLDQSDFAATLAVVFLMTDKSGVHWGSPLLWMKNKFRLVDGEILPSLNMNPPEFSRYRRLCADILTARARASEFFVTLAAT